MNCSYCFTEVKADIFGLKIDCGHWVHTNCLNKKDPDFDNCPECKGEVKLVEPCASRDYISEPLPDSWWNNIKISLKKEPFTFLGQKMSIRNLIIQKRYGLQKLLESGVTINDFLQNNYTWEDLKTFEDFNKDKERSKAALVALKCNAEHFRDHYHVLGNCIKELDINGKDMVEMFGIYFTEKTADVVKLGIKMKDLYGARLTWAEQFESLKPTMEEMKIMGTQKNETLPSFNEPQVILQEIKKEEEQEEQEEIVIKPRRIVVKYEAPKIVVSHGLRPKKK
jgi:hypothetical protein